VRTAWVTGLGVGLKAVTVFPDNPWRQPPLPSVQGEVLVFDEETGAAEALVDGAAVTAWKTAGDSALGADILARPDARTLLMVGAGAMAESLVRAHLAVRPGIETVRLWNRTIERARALADRLDDLGRTVSLALDLQAAVGQADVISCATMATEPIVAGAWLKPGCHLDLVGAYLPTMREADDEALRRGRIFVDCLETAVDPIGELADPIRREVIGARDIVGDLYDLVAGRGGRMSADEITIFKNGGGAHLDLMVARHALAETAAARGA
jgi:ornithine cyclodeaminase